MKKMRALIALVGVFAVACGSSPQFRGVNLGGWFVLESWMVPNFWAQITANTSVQPGQGEWQVCAALGKSACLSALEQHWASWVSQDDLGALAAAGVTHVRIPIGYWALGPAFIAANEPYVSGQWPYLLQALRWLKALGMYALIDLHGAPGSQNGHDNSGFSGPIGWDTPANIARTVDVLSALAANVTAINTQPGTEGVVVGLEVLNEPWTVTVGGPITMETLANFTVAAAAAIWDAGFDGWVMFPDGWDASWPGWQGVLVPGSAATPPPAGRVAYMDSHLYRCFGGYDSLSRWGQAAASCSSVGRSLAAQNGTAPIIVGEYSLCMPNGPALPFEQDDQAVVRAFFESQWSVFGSAGPVNQSTSAAADANVVTTGPTRAAAAVAKVAAPAPGNAAPVGSFFWNFKLEQPDGSWSYLSGLSGGWIPSMPNGAAPGPSWYACT